MSFKGNMLRWLYSWVLFLAVPFYVLKLWMRGRKEPEYSKRIAERFGFYASGVPAHRGSYIWVHAVSLGEARASGVLIDQLRQKMPGMKLLLTHGTATGWEQGKAFLQEGDVQCWVPVDIPWAVHRFIQHFEPRMGLLVETEMWPNLIDVANQHKMPMLLVNARLSERSLNRALKVGVLMRPTYAGLTAALAQSEDDVKRLKEAGVSSVCVVGNMKYDMLPDPELLMQGHQWKALSSRKVVMAASTREGEEELLLQAWQQMQWTQPNENAGEIHKPILLLVPRHPQRFEDVAKQVSAFGFSMSRRSTWQEEGLDSQALNADVWLGDSLREMVMYYALADLVLLGGSFKKYGGQNLIEAFSCGCPVILGEFTYNFALPSELALKAGVACRVHNFEEALSQANVWLQDAQTLESLQKNSMAFIKTQQGAAEKIATYVDSLMKSQNDDISK